MQSRRTPGRPPHPDLLTPAEWEVLDLVRHGMRRSEIARRRNTGVDAVKFHLANICGKLGVGTRDLRDWPGIPGTSLMPPGRPMDPMTTPQSRLGPIGQVSLSIREVARAERFYGETLGLAHLFTFGDLVFFDAGGTRLYLHRRDAAEWQPGSILYFTVDDVHAAQDDLAGRGVAFSGAPHRIHTHDDGTEEWMTFFADGDGNTLALMATRTGTTTALTGQPFDQGPAPSDPR
jgi:DNA-binding CsgD family transcriptional regulator/extradiol dioxygenase family protein